MELNLVELMALLFGGSGIVGVIVGFSTIKYMRWKAKSEAKGAEAEADMKRQDYYQEVIEDLQKDRERMKEIREEQEKYIQELREDRKHLREDKDTLRNENNELQAVIDELRRTQREQGDKIARLGRMQKAMMPLICTNTNCKMRQSDIMGLVADDSFDSAEKIEPKKDVEG